MVTAASNPVAKEAPRRARATKRTKISPTDLQPRFADPDAELAVKTAHGGIRQKLVRDSFTIPKNEYEVLAELKARALALGRASKKSELIRAGIATLSALGDKDLLAILDGVPVIKTGRPSKTKENAKPAKRKS